ncbi:hypothetical protein DSM112329_03785 [Paraconexibacter sp. AEG42_29]|uniref:DUF4173 domain-containing protein n=1 Tax=Paraconexibacter sp. AEG42_29 TaxID=2997339 RepID=A0AAU7AZS6_9ACTN
MSRITLACTLGAGLIAATAVAGQRVGLALSGALLLVLAAAASSAPGRRCPWLSVLAAALAVQPVLRDAGWVVAVAVAASLLVGAAAVAPPGRWPDVRRALVAPLQWAGGLAVVSQAAGALVPRPGDRPLLPIVRGVALAVVLTGGFGLLLASADRAFADLADTALALDVDAEDGLWRAALGLAFVLTAGALVRSAGRVAIGPLREPYSPGQTELRIAIGALVGLFAVFVLVQLRVLFGGARYVVATTGLGYGDYARQGFVQLLLVAALTLAVVAVAARRRDAVVRGLLGVLCALTLVMLVSAHHRLGLVEGAYGFSRVRYAGHAIVFWLAAIFLLTLAAGALPRLARWAPRAAVGLSAVGVLAFCLSNPDGRIADRAVARAAAGGSVDVTYLANLSADALPALRRLPSAARVRVLPRLQDRLREADGLAGFNLARRAAR